MFLQLIAIILGKPREKAREGSTPQLPLSCRCLLVVPVGDYYFFFLTNIENVMSFATENNSVKYASRSSSGEQQFFKRIKPAAIGKRQLLRSSACQPGALRFPVFAGHKRGASRRNARNALPGSAPPSLQGTHSLLLQTGSPDISLSLHQN